MNSHELGDEYEKVCKEYLKKIYSKANPNFINTKLDKVHGIDFAVSLNEDEVLFIVESKGKYAKVAKNQMTKEWIEDRITPELAERIKKNAEKNGIIKYLSFRVNNDNPENPIIKRISPSGSLEAQDFTNNGFTQQNNTIMNDNNDVILNDNNDVILNQIRLLNNLEKDLENFIKTINSQLEAYRSSVHGLASKGVDRNYILKFNAKCLVPTEKTLNDLSLKLKKRDIEALKRLQTRLIATLDDNDYYGDDSDEGIFSDM